MGFACRKERGKGDVKLLFDGSNVRLLMRQEITLKVRANHVIAATSVLEEHPESDKSLLLHAMDFADGDAKEECASAQPPLFASVVAQSLIQCLSFVISLHRLSHPVSRRLCGQGVPGGL